MRIIASAFNKLFKKVIDIKKETAALDFGTNNICVALAKSEKKSNKKEYSSFGLENNIQVLGVGSQMSKGVKYGAIINLEELEDSILGAVSTAEKEAQKSIKSVIVSLPAWAIDSRVVENSINIGQVPIDQVHINSLINFDTTPYLGKDSEIIHIFPISYSVDEMHDVQDPIGMVGKKLSALFHVMSAKSNLLRNIRNCLSHSNIEVSEFVCSSYASLLSVASNDELYSGITLIDIGGSCTSISCVKDGILVYMGILGVGGNSITNDISIVLRTNKSNAERLKILYGLSGNEISQTHDDEQVLVSSIDEFGDEQIQSIPKSNLDYIIASRVDEIFELIKQHLILKQIDQTFYQQIVVTGGGSQISGLSEYLKTKNFFPGSSIRLGKPMSTTGSQDLVRAASFASVAGALIYGFGNVPGRQAVVSPSNQTFFQKLKTWVKRGI